MTRDGGGERRGGEWLQDAAVRSKRTANYRFTIIDNSRSMLKLDGHVLKTDSHGVSTFEQCSRWDEVQGSMREMLRLADAAGCPMEVRLLNKQPAPATVGQARDGGASLAAAEELLKIEPSGLTPICRQIAEVTERLTGMEIALRASGQLAVLLIITDGESTDGNVVEMLTPLEGLPLKVVVRLCTDEPEVSEYWHTINAALDLDIKVQCFHPSSNGEVSCDTHSCALTPRSWTIWRPRRPKSPTPTPGSRTQSHCTAPGSSACACRPSTL